MAAPGLGVQGYLLGFRVSGLGFRAEGLGRTCVEGFGVQAVSHALGTLPTPRHKYVSKRVVTWSHSRGP